MFCRILRYMSYFCDTHDFSLRFNFAQAITFFPHFSPFVKTEKACKICGCSDGNMESMFCDADDSRMLNKIYKCTRVEVSKKHPRLQDG